VITSYDVVNETIDHETHGLMQTSLTRAMGSAEAVVDLAFHTARAQLPEAQLVYNDYMSWEPQHAAHRADVLRLLEGFRRRNVPVDALGIQSHIEILSLDPATGVGPYQEREWRMFLDEVVAMDYKLLATEFDVKDKALTGDVAPRDAKVADYARRYFDVMLDYPQLGDILAWGDGRQVQLAAGLRAARRQARSALLPVRFGLSPQAAPHGDRREPGRRLGVECRRPARAQQHLAGKRKGAAARE
jgi:endo-1,4-beta-xylanase